ncbi:Aspartate aminotransferase [Rosistilla carotiformis]|uniref:Aspartate aminotransferase n=1 Tax=Rosistilla carotiformis TaxID=2528017 RepID=A0A518JZA7_9BACT|nr:amino acid aminotransferase [Rosistilla carotiformis]QDV70880.1 Aspartate aminotransferase [Rosistilla carotiformis]
MFETIQTAPPDSILGLSEAFQKDPNPAKINLSVGVYKDTSGQTPVLRCVKQAEETLLKTETTKGYLGIDGLPEYRQHVHGLVFGEQVPASQVAVVQTPGGTGALRVAADFIATQLRPARVWLSNPTWANHNAIFAAAGVQVETYSYLNAEKTGLDFDSMLDDLKTKSHNGDVVLLHACCHNPTGVDPTAEQWAQIAEVVRERGLLPLVDFAYQGFGQGITEDAVGIRTLLETCDEMLVASSFSKNFGLYSERVGGLSLVAKNPEEATAAMSQLKCIVRTNYSNPPRHGGAIVATVLGNPELTATWHEEVAEMRDRIAAMRSQFVTQMHQRQSKRDFSFLLSQSGMFSFSGLNPMQVDQLRNEYAIYIVGSGRINVAGMTDENLPRLCDAVAAVL